MFFLLICYYLPLEMGGAFHLNKLEFPSSYKALCKVWLKLAHSFSRRKFKILSKYLHYFNIIPPLERKWSNIWTILNLLHPRMLCAKFGWNWPVVLDNKISIFCQCIISLLSPLWIRCHWSFIWTNLDPLYPWMLCAKLSWNWSIVVLEKELF